MPVDLFSAGAAGLPAKVRGGEPLHCPGAGPDRPGSLALGGQMQPERADLRLEFPGI
jgi:hypothetical protein